jgi:DNA-binding transcriptional LysR family regulator
MDWDDLRFFLALARAGSARAAGDALGVSHSTVVRRVDALEARFAAKLFDRHREGYTLTDAGHAMVEGAERVEREMAALERGLVGTDERLAGNLAITSCDHYISSRLLPGLTELCQTHPGIELCFTTDSRSFDLAKREADLAIRILGSSVEPPPFLIGTKLAPVTVCNYVAHAHEARLDPDRGATDARWLSGDDRKIQEMLMAGGSFPEIPAWGSFSSLELMVQAALEGLGLVMLPTYVGDSEPGLRRLERPDLRHLADLWLLCHPDLRTNARVRAARECVRASMAAHQALFHGDLAQGCTSPSENRNA